MSFNIEKFKKITQLSANQSADALTKLSGLKTEITVVNIQLTDLSYQFKQLPSDNYVTGLYLQTCGDITGSTMLIFPKEVAMKLAGRLTMRRLSSHGFDELEVSALKETSNIICGNFFSFLSNKLGIIVTWHLPLFIFDTLFSVLDQFRIWSNDDEGTLLVEFILRIENEEVVGYIILRMSIPRMAKIEAALNKL